MLGKIVYISDNEAHIQVPKDDPSSTALMNIHVIIFEDEKKQILGEVDDISNDVIKVNFLGEIRNGKFVEGIIKKPSSEAHVRVIKKEELFILTGQSGEDSFLLGTSPLYDDYPIYVNFNDLFSNHMAIFGNTGSGKSCGVARLLQNVFRSKNIIPFWANFLIFDSYGEYHNALKDINEINPNYHFKYYTTSRSDKEHQLKIPIWLLDVDDIALLLGATEHAQLPIIERALKLVRIFASDKPAAKDYKNHLIAKAIMSILFTNQTSASKRNSVFSILATCSTKEFNLLAPVKGLGYTRSFRDCFAIDTSGSFPESNLMTEYISGFIDDNLDKYEDHDDYFFTLEDLEKALDFALISEGLLNNEKIYDAAITLKVRLHSLIIGESGKFFHYDKYIDLPNYITSLVSVDNKKAQIVNINLEDIDDSLGKVITKLYTKMLFQFTKDLETRASAPFHIFLEEAHRYVQNDDDQRLIGYNIFERVAKEGRKYGLILDLISQRLVELSETVISQCSNFMIFKTSHPRDLEYIRQMLPNINSEIIEKQKSVQPGTCVAFGRAFKVPMIVRLQMPVPEPHSSNCDIFHTWDVKRTFPKDEE